LWPTLAHAEDEPGDSGEKKPKKEKKKGKLDDKLSFGGRVFARTAMTRVGDDGPFQAQAAIASARVGASYRWEMLRADVEFELVTEKLKDAFLRLRLLDADTTVDVRAGQFKMPFSAIQLESGWKLPVADRGIISGVLTDGLQVAGRHAGVDLEAKLAGAMKPKLVAGIFQGTNDLGDPLSAPASAGFGQTVVVRGTIEPVDGVEIGVAGGERSGGFPTIPVKVLHRWSGELDVTVDVAAGPGRVRLWAEGMAGSSWLIAEPAPGNTRTTFVGGRALAAWRHGGAEAGDCFVEPYAMFGMIDADSNATDDVVMEATGGIGYGAWDVWRLQLELEVWRVGENAPAGIALGSGLVSANSTSLVLQAGAHF
jgi:hypothetical protein